LIGNADMTIEARANRSTIFSRRRQALHRYFAIDGGYGAHLLAALGGYSPYLQAVASPRHADLLIIVTPITQKLIPAIVEIAEALPRPAHVLVLSEPSGEQAASVGMGIANVETLFQDVRTITTASPADVLHALTDTAPWAEIALNNVNVPEAETIQLPSRQEQELATELIVLSLGPVQPFTAGPLRLFLICDGEQVLSVQVESGYAHRGITQAMLQAGWQEALPLARSFDPLAPLACQLAYVQAIEQIQSWQPSPPMVVLREAALALERVHNYLWWLVNFMRLLADAQLSDRAYQLATSFEACMAQLWQQRPSTWILPQWQGKVEYDEASMRQLQQLANALETFTAALAHNRWLMLRTRNIGILPPVKFEESDVSASVLSENELGKDDVQSRLIKRLQCTVSDMRNAMTILSKNEFPPARAEHWRLPVGEAQVTVDGPRGPLGFHASSDGGEKPAHIAWQCPSVALLSLVPQLLTGQKLADAEIIIASLNLAMAEADG
jgi:NADH:ubiquinone oxidoreductase subunit D/Ni,Fe-hydrogenase III small subunit